jgi:hypothetical protein
MAWLGSYWPIYSWLLFYWLILLYHKHHSFLIFLAGSPATEPHAIPKARIFTLLSLLSPTIDLLAIESHLALMWFFIALLSVDVPHGVIVDLLWMGLGCFSKWRGMYNLARLVFLSLGVIRLLLFVIYRA